MSRDDDFDRPAASKPGGLDGFMTNMVVVILLGLVSFFCCPLIGGILGLIGVLTCKTPDGKRNSTIILVISIVSIVLNIILNAAGVVDFNAQMRGLGK